MHILLDESTCILAPPQCTHLCSAHTSTLHTPAPPQCTHLRSAHTSTMHTPLQCTHLHNPHTFVVHTPPQCAYLHLHIAHTSAMVTHTYTYRVHPPHCTYTYPFTGLIPRPLPDFISQLWRKSESGLGMFLPFVMLMTPQCTHTHTHNAHTHHTRATFPTARIIVFRWWSLVTMRWTHGTPPPIPSTTPS